MPKNSDHYLIYEMKGKMIWSTIPKRFGGGKLSGIVSNVIRDVLNSKIKIVLQTGNEYVFREPNAITKVDNKIIFLYGMDHGQETDDNLFLELRKVGGNLGVAIKNITGNAFSFIEFKMREENDKKDVVSKGKRGKGKLNSRECVSDENKIGKKKNSNGRKRNTKESRREIRKK